MRGTGVQNDVLKPMMGNHVSNLRFGKIGYQIKTQPTQLFTREECVYFNFVFSNCIGGTCSHGMIIVT